MSFRTDDLKFDSQANRVIVTMAQYRDLGKTAKRCNLTRKRVKEILSRPEVAAAYQSYVDKIDWENAKQFAQSQVFNKQFLDAKLVEMIEDEDVKDEVRIKALELGYKAQGALSVEQREGSGNTFVFELHHIEAKSNPALPPARPVLQASTAAPKVKPATDDGPIIEFIQPKTGTSA